MAIKDIVQKLLDSTKVITKYLIRPDITKHENVMSFHFFLQQPSVFSGGKIRKMGGQLQVDLWSTKTSPMELSKTVRSLLISHGFRFSGATETADEVSGIRAYHVVLRFNFIESEVLRNA